MPHWSSEPNTKCSSGLGYMAEEAVPRVGARPLGDVLCALDSFNFRKRKLKFKSLKIYEFSFVANWIIQDLNILNYINILN